jgi:outer membrane protein
LNKSQIILLSSAVLLGIGLWFANRKGTDAKSEETAPVAGSADFRPVNWESYIDSSIQSYSGSSREKFMLFRSNYQSAEGAGQKAAWADSLAGLFYNARNIVGIAYFREMKALASATEEAWMNAGNDYYRAANFSTPQLRAALFQKAIEAYDKAIQLNPDNLQALTSKGVCYVEGTGNPMEGITILREVLSKDSTFAEAHFQLGMFAIQSGQFEKALDRMEKVLKINPAYITAHLYKGQVYQQMGNLNEAIRSLEMYRDLSNEPEVKAQVNEYLVKLKNKNNS